MLIENAPIDTVIQNDTITAAKIVTLLNKAEEAALQAGFLGQGRGVVVDKATEHIACVEKTLARGVLPNDVKQSGKACDIGVLGKYLLHIRRI